MVLEKKPIVFVIMPFNEDVMALYERLKDDFKDDFEFTHAADLDNQRNILQDIVEGIHQASIVVADLSGLNPNVFYELGLAHAMNKKVIIITQDINELPFDIKPYRAVEYSLLFYKISDFLKEMKKLLHGAMDGSLKFGNPVSDYIPNFYSINSNEPVMSVPNEHAETVEESHDESEIKGYLDYIADISENSEAIKTEIDAMSEDMQEMTQAINQTSNDVNRVKAQSGGADASYVRGACRKLAVPVDAFAGKMRIHVSKVTYYWSAVENDYLSLLDSPIMQIKENVDGIKNGTGALEELRDSIIGTDSKIESFISSLQTSLGVERRLNKAITNLIAELEAYLSMTDKMSSSIERIIAKSEIVVSNAEKAIT